MFSTKVQVRFWDTLFAQSAAQIGKLQLLSCSVAQLLPLVSAQLLLRCFAQ
tara:strand:+ start:922 stop:1074 length:153 start_codon:yes stop_codon:yes gene_type:complete